MVTKSGLEVWMFCNEVVGNKAKGRGRRRQSQQYLGNILELKAKWWSLIDKNFEKMKKIYIYI